MSSQRRQLVLCVGPRCRVRGDLAKLHATATELAAAHADTWSVALYECFGRCPAGPNACVLRLPDGADPHADPGYRELDQAEELSGLTVSSLRGLFGTRPAPDR